MSFSGTLDCSFNNSNWYNISDGSSNIITLKFTNSNPTFSLDIIKNEYINYTISSVQINKNNSSLNVNQTILLGSVSNPILSNTYYDVSFSKISSLQFSVIVETTQYNPPPPPFPPQPITTSYTIQKNQSISPTEWNISENNSTNNFNVTYTYNPSTSVYSFTITSTEGTGTSFNTIAPIIMGCADILHNINEPAAPDTTQYMGGVWLTSNINYSSTFKKKKYLKKNLYPNLS